MTEQWQELKETIIEMRDNDGTGTQQEACKFLANYMEVLEKQMQEPCDDCTVIKKLSKKYYVEDAYGYTDEGIVNKVNEIIDAVNESSSTPQIEPCEDAVSRSELLSHNFIITAQNGISHRVIYASRVEEAPSVIPQQLPSVTPRTNLAETSQDCISRQKALDCFEQTNTRQGAKYAIETLPSVTPQRPKGKWIEVLEHKDEFSSTWHYECSECRGRSYKGFEPLEKYCPNCGAEMSGGEEDEVSD